MKKHKALNYDKINELFDCSKTGKFESFVISLSIGIDNLSIGIDRQP